MKTANLAIVFTDIKGFTERTSRQTLEQNEQLLAAHERILAPIFRAFSGRIVKSIGDAFLVTFESPTNAVLAGVAAQDALWKYNQSATDDSRLEVRVAINVGEVRVEAGDVFGEPVNIAARVEGITDAGEIYFTEAVYLSMNKAEVPAEEVGRFELKGIPGKIRVFKVPRAPYRVEAQDQTADGAPYGNLGLSKMPEDAFARATQELTARAAELTSRALHQGESWLGKGLAQLRQRRIKRRAWAATAAFLALTTGLSVALRPGPIERAIADVGSATSVERDEKIEAAKQLIAEEKDLSARNFHYGLLAEALDDANPARYYRASAKQGFHRAENRLIDLLESARCSLRSQAASALADLNVTRARSQLEKLAENGGADDTQKVLFLGCDSRQAARDALAQLK